PENYAGFVAKVNCTRNELTPALLQVRVNNYASKTIGPLMACQKKYCKIEQVWIQRPTVHTALLRHKKGASFHLSARVLVRCNDSLIIRPLWRIYLVEDMKAIPKRPRPISTSQMHGVNTIRIAVPGSALDYGLYLFHFFVKITAYWSNIILNGSDSIYIQIDRTDLIANIAGGTFRTVGFSDSWTLDGSSSSDPDSVEGLKGIRFTWYCTRRLSDYSHMRLSIGKKCHPAQRNLKWLTSSGPVHTVAPETLHGNTLYYFRLVIQKDTRQSYADQTVHVKPGSPPILNVVCLENCGKTVIPTERLTLSGKCLNCRRSRETVYRWSLFSAEKNSTEIKFDWSSRTSTGRSGPYLSIHALSFMNTAYQSYVLLLKVTNWDGRSSIYRYSFKLNSPPNTGKCTITPRWGTAFVTKFVVRCSGFSDVNLPLIYKVIVASEVPKTTKISSLEENTFGTILYFGYQPETPPSFLPVGVPSQKYTLGIYVQVYNSLGAFKQVSLYVKVQNPVESRPVGLVFHELLASVNGMSAPMTSYLQTGDYFNAGYLTYIAASVLNYMKAAPTLQISKVQFRENLIKAALNISMGSIIEMNQVVASIFQVTEDTDEINTKSQELAIQKLIEVTKVLKIQWNESHWSEQTEIQTSGILRCLSNILRASLLHKKNVNVDGIKQVFFIMENLTDIVLQGKVPGEIETVMETKKWSITLNKNENWNVTDAFSTIRKCKNCFYPNLKKGNYSELPRDAVISTALYEFEENPFPWLGFTSEIATMVLGFKMTESKANGDLGGIMPEGADIIIARKDTKSLTFQLAIGPDKTQRYTTGGFRVEVERNTREVYIQIVTKLQETFKVLVFASANVTHASPIASFSAFHNKPTDASKTKTSNTDCNIKASYIICLPKSLLRAAAQESGTDNTGKYNISIVLLSRYVVRYQNTRLVSISIFSDQCLFLDGIGSHWKESTCKLGSYTSWQRVHCICNMKWRQKRLVKDALTNTSTFNIKFLAAKVIVTPNTVDLEKSLIADIPQNPVALLTVVAIFLVYLVLALWAMKTDKADRARKDKIIVLPDNDPFDKVCFLVTIYTGSRLGAGTTADVFLQLIGQDGTSDVHCLQHPHFPSFCQGSTDTFLLTTKKDLGDICAMRLWHNNKGPSPSWFLSRAKVENLYTRKTWLFICRKWLALNKDDALLERTFFAMNPKARISRIDYFLINLAENLIDGHLWFSIFAHTVTGTFSRLQRSSCCLAILLLNLVVNIMFFNADKREESPLHLRYLRSIAVGVESALITIPLQMLIIALFRYSPEEPSSWAVTQKNPKKIPSITSQNLANWKAHLSKRGLSGTSAQSRNDSLSENLPGASNSQCLQNYRQERNKETPQTWSNCTISERDANVIVAEKERGTKTKLRQKRQASNSNFNNSTVLEEDNFQREKKTPSNTSVSFRKRSPIVLCWWCVYFSWALIIAVTGLSSFFIVLYGLAYGYQTSLEWLLASAISFFENVFLLQTLKIILLSAVNTILPKYCESITWLTQENYSEIKLDKAMETADEMREMHCKLVKIRDSKQYKPLEADEIAIILKKAKTKKKTLVFLKDIISHLVFLTLILNLAYSIENTNSFYYNQFIHDQFSTRLSSVDKLEHIYTWVNGVFLPLLHNDIQPTFLSDSCSKTIGLPRMRQVRAKDTEKKCFRPSSFVNKYVISKSHCLHNYGSDTEEKGDYAGTWIRTAKEYITKNASNYTGFTYQPNKTPWVYYSYGDLHIYGPAGYPFYFFPAEGRQNSTKRLAILQKSNWLDEKTWAVIIELTTFNPDVDLFCCISVIFEVSYFGTVNSSLSVHSFALPIFHQQTTAQMAMFVIVLVFLFLYTADELHTICRENKDYINNFSNIINFCLKSVLLLFVVLKVIKFKMGADIVKFYLLHPNDFIHFHAVSHLDQILRITMGFLAFFTVLKTLRYSRLFYGVRLAQRSILAALPGISSMAFLVIVYFFVFMAFGYLVFGQHEWNYNNMIHSAQTVFSYCVSAFRGTEFSSNRLLGALFLASFMLLMISVLINLFQAVIISAYEEMKQPVYEEPCDEAEVVTFLIKQLRNVWDLLIHKTPKSGDPDLLHSIFYGQPQRRHHRHLGLKNRKINGKKMVYLVI
ncbi:PKDRE protein, partial [Eudromia elegans]|nr:PKDRE protein [Eudromia elegans]